VTIGLAMGLILRSTGDRSPSGQLSPFTDNSGPKFEVRYEQGR
jgi:hypothetical protein